MSTHPEGELGTAEERLASKLGAYDDAVAAGEPAEGHTDELSGSDLAEYNAARECIDLLNEVWDRGFDPDASTAPNGGEPGGAGPDGELLPAIRVPGFRLQGLIGRGGMGVVYRAFQESLKREVALKFLPPHLIDDPDRLRRFRNEAEAAASVAGAGILPVHDVLQVGGAPVLVMQYVDGVDLARVIAGRIAASRGEPDPLGLRHPWADLPDLAYREKILGAFDQLVPAVAALHAAKIIHRDIKPSNVLLDARGHLWLSDFGLARLGDESDLTRDGTQLGSRGFMSPEQWDAHVELDRRVDVFGLGATIYQALSLRLPYGTGPINARTPLAPPPGSGTGTGPSDLDTVILKALEPDREDRYDSCEALAADWELARRGELPAASRPLRLARTITRRVLRRSWSLSDLMIAVAFVGILVLAWRGARSPSRPDPGPPPFTRTVSITTRPAGARVVLVPLDPETGFPRPERRIRPARNGLTPVRIAAVPPGDYLVEAEVKGFGFHEVFRHVPAKVDSPSSVITGDNLLMTPLHRSWTLQPDGTAVLPPIDIPSGGVTSGMALVPGAPSFTLGDAKLGLPPHPVAVEPFAIDTAEVSNAEFRSAFGTLPGNPEDAAGTEAPDFPAVFVSQDMAVEYAERVGKRLPWEREYEFAATCGGMPQAPPEPRRPGESPRKAWAFGGVRTTGEPDRLWNDAPVFGLFSNAAEWTNDWGVPYPGVPKSGVILRPDETRIVRGGTPRVVDRKPLGPGEHLLTPRFRYWLHREERHAGLGFRCARSLRPHYLD